MATSTVSAIPPGMHSLTPHLTVAGAADAIAFYSKAFGAVEQARMPTPDGKLIHASVKIGDSMLMLVDENPAWGIVGPKALNGTSVTIHLAVDDVDAVYARAIEAGATVRMAPTDMFWGARYGVLIDPFGHSWSVATQIREVSIEEAQAAMRSQFGGAAS